MKAMRHKYEGAMKDKMLMKLERDKMASKVNSMEKQLKAANEAISQPASRAGTANGASKQQPNDSGTRSGGGAVFAYRSAPAHVTKVE